MNEDGCGTVFWGKKGNQVPGQNFVCATGMLGRSRRRMFKIL